MTDAGLLVATRIKQWTFYRRDEAALAALKADHEFLLKGGVFTKEMLEAYIELKTEEARLVSTQVHPIEFDLYYSC